MVWSLAGCGGGGAAVRRDSPFCKRYLVKYLIQQRILERINEAPACGKHSSEYVLTCGTSLTVVFECWNFS